MHWKHLLAIVLVGMVWIIWGVAHAYGADPELLKTAAEIVLPILSPVFLWLGVSSPKMPPLLARWRRPGPGGPPGVSVLSLLCLGGCLGAVAPILDCTERVIADAAKQMPVAAIVEDVGPACSLDAADVMAILLQHSDRTKGTRAYAEAVRVHRVPLPPGEQ